MTEYRPEEQQNTEHSYSWHQLNQCCMNHTVLYARAYLFDAQRQLHFRLGCCEGIMPFGQAALDADKGLVKDIAILTKVGHIVCFTVKELVNSGEKTSYAILSRAQAQKACKEAYFDTLQPGDIISARVCSMEQFGAFCDVGCGLIALLPIDYLSVSRISSPADRLTIGQNIFCAVKKRDEYGRLVLTMKELLGSWDENAANFAAGETVLGRVRGIEDYGVFVEIAPNLAGLAETRQNLEIGDCVSVYIKSILPERMKIKLIVLGKIAPPPPLPEPHYYIRTGRLQSWQYASAASGRQIGTIF